MTGLAVALVALPLAASVASADIQNTGFYIDLIEQGSNTGTHFVVPMRVNTAELQDRFMFVPGADLNWGTDGSGPTVADQLPSDDDVAQNQYRNQRFNGRDAVSLSDNNLHIVPLPTSALAGLGLLSGLAGIRHMRRRK